MDDEGAPVAHWNGILPERAVDGFISDRWPSLSAGPSPAASADFGRALHAAANGRSDEQEREGALEQPEAAAADVLESAERGPAAGPDEGAAPPGPSLADVHGAHDEAPASSTTDDVPSPAESSAASARASQTAAPLAEGHRKDSQPMAASSQVRTPPSLGGNVRSKSASPGRVAEAGDVSRRRSSGPGIGSAAQGKRRVGTSLSPAGQAEGLPTITNRSSSKSNVTVVQPFKLATDIRRRQEHRSYLCESDKPNEQMEDAQEAHAQSNDPILEQKPPEAATFSFALDQRAKEREKFHSKLEQIESTRGWERQQQELKMKEELNKEREEYRKGLTFKANPLPEFYQKTTVEDAGALHESEKRQSRVVGKKPVFRPTRAVSPKLGRRRSSEGTGNGSLQQVSSPHAPLTDQKKKNIIRPNAFYDKIKKVPSKIPAGDGSHAIHSVKTSNSDQADGPA
eukprot:SM000004S14920  [mRNA]  locus=s4:245041:248856:+ [translate_table: standard]